MLYILVAYLRDVHQPVLMHADIHERAEVDHVAHSAGQLHALFEIVDIEDVRAQHGLGHLVAGIASGLAELLDDVVEGGQADTELIGKSLCPELFCSSGQIAEFRRFYFFIRIIGKFQKLLCHGVALGVNAGIVQRIAALGYAQKTRTLFKGLRSQLGHLL